MKKYLLTKSKEEIVDIFMDELNERDELLNEAFQDLQILINENKELKKEVARLKHGK